MKIRTYFFAVFLISVLSCTFYISDTDLVSPSTLPLCGRCGLFSSSEDPHKLIGISNTSGGFPPYKFNWVLPDNTEYFGQFIPYEKKGIYTCLMTDSTGIKKEFICNMECPNGRPKPFFHISTDLLGFVNITHLETTGGIAPYTYSWKDIGVASPSRGYLGRGTYTLYINDSNGCYSTPYVFQNLVCMGNKKNKDYENWETAGIMFGLGIVFFFMWVIYKVFGS